MQIIDRYLLRQFAQVFLICFCSMTGLFIVIDGFGNLEDFISFAEKQGGLLSVMSEYYAYQAISFFDRMSGVLTLIAAMFTVTWIQRHQELTALLAAGISKARIVAPVIGAVIAISLFSAINREFVIPHLRHKMSRTVKDLSGGTAKSLQARYDNTTDILFRGKAIYSGQQKIEKPSFLLPAALSQLGKQLTAAVAFYQPAHDGRPSGYLFQDVDQPRGLDDEPSLQRNGQTVVLTARDTPWLKPGECFVVSDVSFEQLEGGTSWRQFSSTLELMRGLRNRSLDFGADLRVAIHARLVQPLLDITLLFLGMPLVLARSNRNVFMAIGLCVIVVSAFMLVVVGCQYLGSSYLLGPAFAAWLPLMIFIPSAVGLSDPLYE